MLNAFERKLLHELVEREELLRSARIPAQEGQVVEERLREIALLTKEDEVGFRMPSLGELGSVVGKDQRHVRVSDRPLIAQRVDEHELVGRIGKVLLTADHMCDFHHRVVDRARKLVGRIAV